MVTAPVYPQFQANLFQGGGRSMAPTNGMSAEEYLRKMQEQAQQNQQQQQQQFNQGFDKNYQKQQALKQQSPDMSGVGSVAPPAGVTQPYGQGMGVFPTSSVSATTAPADYSTLFSQGGGISAGTNGGAAYGSGAGMFPTAGTVSADAGSIAGAGAGSMALPVAVVAYGVDRYLANGYGGPADLFDGNFINKAFSRSGGGQSVMNASNKLVPGSGKMEQGAADFMSLDPRSWLKGTQSVFSGIGDLFHGLF